MGNRNEIGTAKSGDEPVYLTDDQRATHTHVIGASGSGKSKLLELMIRRDIMAGNGLCLIDPHGTLYDRLVQWCALKDVGSKRQQVHLFEPTVQNWTFGFNPLGFEVDDRYEADYCVDSVMKVFSQIWGGEDTTKTPLLKRCLKMTLFTLVANGMTLLEARELTSTEDPRSIRAFLTSNLEDSIYRQEWKDMDSAGKKRFNEYFSSTNNRLFDFLSAQTVKHIIGQQARTLDVRRIMDNGDILLVDLSSRNTRFSREHARLVGSLMVNDMLLKARRRAEGSQPFHLYIDECYRYLNEDIEDILFQARKFGLHLTLSHQDLSQLGPPDGSIRGAVMGGAQTKIVFRIGKMEDAKTFAEQIFAGEIDYEEPKKEFVSYQTVGHEPTWLINWAKQRSSTSGWAEGKQESEMTDEEGETVRKGTAETKQRTGSEQTGYSVGVRQAERPIIEETYQQAYTLQEQIHKLAAYIKSQDTRNAILKTPADKSRRFEVAEVPDYPADDQRLNEMVAEFKQARFKRSEFVKPTDKAADEIQERQQQLVRAANKGTQMREEPAPWR
jgi:hypothetical protein